MEGAILSLGEDWTRESRGVEGPREEDDGDRSIRPGRSGEAAKSPVRDVGRIEGKDDLGVRGGKVSASPSTDTIDNGREEGTGFLEIVLGAIIAAEGGGMGEELIDISEEGIATASV